MDELSIRSNRGTAAPGRRAAGKVEKPAGGGQVSGKTAAFTVTETLQRLMTRISQAENRSRVSRGTLQTGEGVLAEVQESLRRMGELAQESAADGAPDRDALQAELEQLRAEIDRMTGCASSGGAPLFLDVDAGSASEGAQALLHVLMCGENAQPELAQTLPRWLIEGIGQDAVSAQLLLHGLGLDRTASGAELLAALAGSALEDNAAAGRLAALYLGAVIAGGAACETVSPDEALEGLRQLLEHIAAGVQPDQAVAQLTKGMFSGLSDFQEQFTGGTAPGLQNFLIELLLSGQEAPILGAAPLLSLLSQAEGADLELMMGLLTAFQSGETAVETGAAEYAGAAGGLDAAGGELTAVRFGELCVTGGDLSKVAFDSASGELTVDGESAVDVWGTKRESGSEAGGEIQILRIAGTGTVRLHGAAVPALVVDGPKARVFSAGRNIVGEIVLRQGAGLTLAGGGLLRTGTFRGDGGNTLHIIEGAVAVEGGEGEKLGALAFPVVLEGPASLAAQAAGVRSPEGAVLGPFDLVWKTLLPGWSGITSLALDGRQTKAALTAGSAPDPVRLWLERGDPSSHGHPAHTLMIWGKDAFGRAKTRYAYLFWNRDTKAFQQVLLYPNPFTVTGGEEDRDWAYEEGSRTLYILSNQVQAVSGGFGMDANQAPFSGRIVLADGIGAVELTLGGVICRVTSGSAFCLGRGNDVTLILQRGTNSLLKSGLGCAGISVEDGTALRIGCADCQSGAEEPAGTLTAAGGAGGAGIGGALGAPAGDVSLFGGAAASAVSAAERGAELFGGCGRVLISGGVSAGGGKSWLRAGMPLHMAHSAVTLPCFPLSSRSLGLDRLGVDTQERARAAGKAIAVRRRQVAQIQAAYYMLHDRLEQDLGGLYSVRRYIDRTQAMVRNSDTASTLLQEMRRSILGQAAQAMSTHSRRGKEDVRQLLR